MPITNREKVKATWKVVIVLSIIFFVIIVAQDIIRESVLVSEEVVEYTSALETDFKDNIKTKVESSVYDIEQMIENRDINITRHLDQNVEVIKSSLDQTIHLLDGNSFLEDELILEVIEHGLIDTDHEYFLIDTSGTLLYDGMLMQETNTDVTLETDLLNRTYFSELITQSETSDFVAFNTAFMIDDVYTEYKYLGYKLEDSNYIILIRGDLNSFTDKSIVDYFATYMEFYNDDEDKMIVFDSSGSIHFHQDPSFLHENIDTIFEDGDYISELLQSLDYRNQGFINETSESRYEIPDIGYFEYNNDTDLIVLVIGESESANLLIDSIIDHNISNIIYFLLPFYIVMTGIIILVTRKIISNIKLSDQVSLEEEVLSKTLANTTEDFIIITNKKGYILYMNDLVKKTLFEDEVTELVNLDDLMVEEEGFKVLIGIQENYYIKYSILPITFNSEDSDLYVIKDVTEKVNKERELEQLTLQDDLTKLGNRRQLVRDYNDFILPVIKDGNKAFLAMIDLDNFKQANDLYGHGFGDEVLTNISDIFKEVVTDNLKIYRVGGDEFALLAVKTTQNTLLSILRKLRNKVSNFKYRNKIDISFSGGLVEINIKSSKRRLSDYYDRADELLYTAKKEGKGKVKI